MNIRFIFSNQYEQVIAHEPMDFECARGSLESIERLWAENHGHIERALKDITGLEFIEKGVRCYLNSRASFSDPLSLKITDPKTMLDNLTHELIHVILTQNYERIGDKIQTFHKKYGSEVFVTRIHILVHAIHFLVAKNIFPNRVKDIHEYATSLEYRKSWEIIDKMGAENIVRSVLG